MSSSVSLPIDDPSALDVTSTPPVTESLEALAARRGRIAAVLTALIMLAYFGFILLVAFAKPMAGTLLAGGRVSVGILLGAGVIVLAPVLTGIYVWWANRHYDVQVRRIQDHARGGRS